ncbi:MAG: kinase, partial [Sphaerospermopsis kisseleviana]
LNLPKSIFCLKQTRDPKFPHRFQVMLPKWCVDDIELLRWILGFKGGVKVVKPELLVNKIKQIGEDIVNIYK